jgi:NADH-quinone oxidoreductase subunit F
MPRINTIADLQTLRAQLIAASDPARTTISVCDGTGCRALGSQKVLAGLRDEVSKARLKMPIDVVGTGCPGFCERGPLITVYPQRLSYQRVQPGDVPEIVARTLARGEIVERLLYTDPQTGVHIHIEPDLPFYRKQKRVVLDLNGRIDPTRIEDYIAMDGYAALARVLGAMSPDQVIAQVQAAGLRGRGGAGFPTGVKWEATRRAIQNSKVAVGGQ